MISIKNDAKELEAFQNTLNQMPYGIGLFDLTTEEPVFLNAAYYEMIGCTPEEYVVTHQNGILAALSPDDLYQKENSAAEFQKTGKALNYEYRIVRKDGSVCWVKMNSAVLQMAGASFAIAFFLISPRKKKPICRWR